MTVGELISNKNLKYYPVSELKDCRIHGRNKVTGDVLPLFWNHSGIEIECTGSELWIELEADFSVFEPWAALEINGAFMMRQMLMPGRYPLCLFRGMSYGDEKRAFFYRELQAMGEDNDCHVLIRGIYTDGEIRKLPSKSCRIEFIGDSISSGEGTYGAHYDMDWIPMYMSSSRHYANIIEKELNAEVRIISQGGWGVYCGWDGDTSHNIPSVYDKVCGLAYGDFNEGLGASEIYEPEEWMPDAVIINLGTNDMNAFDMPTFYDVRTGTYNVMKKGPDGKPDKEHAAIIRNAAKGFMAQIRRLYPSSHILWVYGMMGQRLSGCLEAAVKEYKAESGDDNTAFLLLPDTEGDGFGSREHPGFLSHEKAAAVMIGYLRNNGIVKV